ncbi:alternative ribosome rescue aminoacyl-tRNA hydrolase ArfB [Nocardioides aestuarii]|uniref:Alternative ribosome rescue aminoacyl-tRNA hydrolase ArfB n=1 Tax=Nocardioides aestuarii TaxID=252231 RepID=A0ABW4TSY4_9ACTN
MPDLRVPPGPGLPEGLLIPAAELLERFSRSSGPGGQHANTTDTRVELVFDGTSSSVLTERERVRVGLVTVVASEHRSQHRNRAAARERLAAAVREALAPPPPPRVPTKPSKASRRRRMEAKKRRGQTKALRGRVRD